MDRSTKSPWAIALAIVGAAALLAGASTLLFELTGWLKNATWKAVAILDALQFFGVPEPSFSDWYGAQKLWAYCRYAPLSLVSLVIGMILSYASSLSSRREASRTEFR